MKKMKECLKLTGCMASTDLIYKHIDRNSAIILPAVQLEFFLDNKEPVFCQSVLSQIEAHYLPWSISVAIAEP